MKRLICFTLLILASHVANADPWTAYLGSQDHAEPWSKLVRGVGRGETGLSLPENIDKYVSQIEAIDPAYDIMSPLSGISGQEDRLNPFMDSVHSGESEWSDIVELHVATVRPFNPDGDRFLFQLGNEITKENISASIRSWVRSRLGIQLPGTAASRDREVIPYYVEYLFAPTAAALIQASEKHHGDPDAIPVVLGSVGNYMKTESRNYFSDLLNYKIKGTFAPGLAGKAVYEVVDIATFHYPGDNDNTAEGWSQWNTVKALWTTEDLGRSWAEANKGAAIAPRTLGRQLSLFDRFQLSSKQARVNM